MVLHSIEPEVPSLLVELLWLVGLALACTSLGFYRIVYFVSLGYVLSIAAMGIVTPIRHLTRLTGVAALQNGLLVLWGLRLAVYLIRRESRSAYRKELAVATQSVTGLSWPAKIPIWLGVSVCYALMFSPSLFRLTTAGVPSSAASWMVQVSGLLLMAVGFVLETVADRQKSEFKEESPNRYCDVGLYRWVRYPNYLGEIIVWLGSWITALVAYDTLLKWVMSTIGLIFIVAVMIGSTLRLEKRHDEKYGGLSGYQDYVRTVPILIPFVPLYHLKTPLHRDRGGGA